MEQPELVGRVGEIYFYDDFAAQVLSVSADTDYCDGSMVISYATFLFEEVIVKILHSESEMEELDIFNLRFLTREGRRAKLRNVAILHLPLGYDGVLYSPHRQTFFNYKDAYVK